MGRSKMESQEKRREPHFDTHHIVLKERKSAMLTGVKEVLSFDSEEVQLDTIRGHLTITGKGCHASTPHLGKNPNLIAANIILAFEDLYQQLKEKKGK